MQVSQGCTPSEAPGRVLPASSNSVTAGAPGCGPVTADDALSACLLLRRTHPGPVHIPSPLSPCRSRGSRPSVISPSWQRQGPWAAGLREACFHALWGVPGGLPGL